MHHINWTCNTLTYLTYLFFLSRLPICLPHPAAICAVVSARPNHLRVNGPGETESFQSRRPKNSIQVVLGMGVFFHLLVVDPCHPDIFLTSWMQFFFWSTFQTFKKDLKIWTQLSVSHCSQVKMRLPLRTMEEKKDKEYCISWGRMMQAGVSAFKHLSWQMPVKWECYGHLPNRTARIAFRLKER